MKSPTTDWFEKLTSAEKEIWKLIYYHPNMISSRTEALDLMFCMIGTGISWSNGKLEDTIDNNYMNCLKQVFHNVEDDIFKKAWDNTFSHNDSRENLSRAEIEWMKNYSIFLNCRAEAVLANIEKLTITSHIPNHFYPICQYSNLISIPNNVESDWLVLAVETYNLIMCCDRIYKSSQLKNVNIENKNELKKVTSKLNKLIKKHGLSLKLIKITS